MRLRDEALISAESIRARTAELADAITRDYAGKPLCLLCVLKGAAPFTMALMQSLRGDIVLDFIRAQSYAGTESTGTVELVYTPDAPLRGRDVLLVEDILDTGRTAAALRAWTEAQAPASIRICTLLDKAARREVAVQADYTGFAIDDHFVVGFGLDHDERYRELPDIRVLES